MTKLKKNYHRNSDFRMKKITIGHICYSRQNFYLIQIFQTIFFSTSIAISERCGIYYFWYTRHIFFYIFALFYASDEVS